MEYYTTIEIDNCIKQIIFKPALYMDLPLWEITLNDKNYIIRKSEDGTYLCTDNTLDAEILKKIGTAIDYFRIKDAS